MARAYLLFVLLFTTAINAQDSKLIASSCHADGRRCSGTAYCSACSNCSGCANCNSGGTCGVCTSYETQKKVYKKPVKKAIKPAVYTTKATKVKPSTKKKSIQSFYNSTPTYSVGDKIYVSSEILNLREGPGTNYPIIETLEKGDTLELLGYDGEWIQVIILKSKNVGYVKSKFVN